MVITLDDTKQRIVIKEDTRVVRMMDLSKLDKSDSSGRSGVEFWLSADVEMKVMLVRVPKEYDLVRIAHLPVCFCFCFDTASSMSRTLRAVAVPKRSSLENL